MPRPNIWFFPYRRGSGSVLNLVEELENSRIIRRENSTYFPRQGDKIINWGSYNLPLWILELSRIGARLINRPEAVEIATSKMRTFDVLERTQGVIIPEWTRDLGVAQNWEGRVLGRSIDRGSEGVGITVYDSGRNVLAGHTFYTRYFKKADEYRVHVFNNEILDVQRKLRTRGVEAHPIRNTANGYIFAREGVVLPDGVGAMCIAACRALGLNFGAVDVGYNRHYSRACIFEVNTAPGLEGTTVRRYAEAIRNV